MSPRDYVSSCLFGPVRSRRLGISLGIDLIPPKTCTLDCVYCECGATTELTLTRGEYVPFERVKTELKNFLDSKPALDFITFSGSGEPTLYSRLGDVIRFLKSEYSSYKIALITNSTLLNLKNVQEEIMDVDLLLPSLDAATESVFKRINRPVAGIKVEQIIQGLAEVKRRFKGLMWLEVFIVPGINDDDAEVNALKDALIQINPDRVQLNSLDRPGTCDWVQTTAFERLDQIKKTFSPLSVEIISFKSLSTESENARNVANQNIQDAILSTISRRPCTIEDLISITSSSKAQVSLSLQELLANGRIAMKQESRGCFYRKAK